MQSPQQYNRDHFIEDNFVFVLFAKEPKFTSFLGNCPDSPPFIFTCIAFHFIQALNKNEVLVGILKS